MTWRCWLWVWCTGAGLAAPVQPRAERAASAGIAASAERAHGRPGTSPGPSRPQATGEPVLDGQRARAQMMLRRQRYRQLLIETRKGLKEHPTDPALHQMHAIGLAEYGDYLGAQQSFSEAMGSEYAVVMGLVAEADTLRVVGAPGQAAAVRRELLVSGVSPTRELVMLSRLFEDLRRDHDLEGMWDVAQRAMSVDPTTGLAHAMMALYFIEMGDEDEAGASLWLAGRQGGGAALCAIAETEFHLSFGRPLVAAAVSTERREKVLKSKAFMAVRGRALLAAGNIDKAVELSDLNAWKMSGEIWDPELLAVRAVAFSEMGWLDEGLAIAGRLEQSYPHLDAVQDALDRVERIVDAAQGTTP